MKTETSTITTIGGKEYVADFPMPETLIDTADIPEEHILRYVQEGWRREATDEHLRLIKGGRNGKDRPSEEGIKQLMAVWAPGRNYLKEQRAAAEKALRIARMDRLRAKLAKLEDDPNQATIPEDSESGLPTLVRNSEHNHRTDPRAGGRR